MFVAKDVCYALDIDNVTKALYSLDEDEKLHLPLVRSGQLRTVNTITKGGNQTISIINIIISLALEGFFVSYLFF